MDRQTGERVFEIVAFLKCYDSQQEGRRKAIAIHREEIAYNKTEIKRCEGYIFELEKDITNAEKQKVEYEKELSGK